MKTPAWFSWLREWLTHHPLKAPPPWLEASYRDEVMARVRSAAAPSPAWRSLLRPRWILAYGTACAAVLVAASVLVSRPARDRLMVADAEVSDDLAWIDDQATVLSDLGEDPAWDPDEEAGEAWLDELRWLDDAEVAAS